MIPQVSVDLIKAKRLGHLVLSVLFIVALVAFVAIVMLTPVRGHANGNPPMPHPSVQLPTE